MSDNPAPSLPRRQGLIGTLLSAVGQAIATLLASLFFSLLTEWVGMAFIWPAQGVQHSLTMMQCELGWFADNVRQSLLLADPVSVINDVLSQTGAWLWQNAGLAAWLVWLHDHPWLNGLAAYLQAAVYVVMTFVLRLFILLLTAPLFVLAALTGAVDGLVRRDVRRFGRGYESGFIYHHARRRVMPVFFLAWVVYLSLPFSVPPWVVLLPAAVLFGLVISITVGSFKKFL